MRTRFVLFAALFASALALEGQQNMFRIELVPTGRMVSLNEPTLVNGSYLFKAWPDGETTRLPQDVVRKITRITGKYEDMTVYELMFHGGGFALARDIPVVKNGMFIFHTWRSGALTSVRKSEVEKIGTLTGNQAFWIEQGQMGEALIGNLAMEGTAQVISIGTPPGADSSQAGRNSASSLNQSGQAGISGAPQGNWLYQGTPGVSDAYSPANATMSNGVPTMPAATNGGSPPQ
jgi:hypothetical protein